MQTLWLIVLCGALAIAYAIWATRWVLSQDAGSERMQEIAAAVREGAQAYLKRQYSTIAIVGMDKKKENSSAEARDIPASWPAAIVDIEREVPGNTADKIWQAPIQMACPKLISSMCQV